MMGKVLYVAQIIDKIAKNHLFSSKSCAIILAIEINLCFPETS